MALAQRLARRPQQNNAESDSDAKSPREIGHRWPCRGVVTIEVSESYDCPQMRRDETVVFSWRVWPTGTEHQCGRGWNRAECLCLPCAEGQGSNCQARVLDLGQKIEAEGRGRDIEARVALFILATGQPSLQNV